MQWFDVKWEERLREQMIITWLISRYMDDGRTFLPPIKPGWRWVEDGMKFTVAWAKEDQELSSMELTRRALLGSLGGVEEFLAFTMETGEDFGDAWLPTLDTSLHVNNLNRVLHRVLHISVQRRTAMGENALIQTLSNDLMRRLLNNSEDQGAAQKRKIVDDYGQKLMNSGFEGAQMKRIVLNGIKGYEGRRRRCVENNWRLHRTSTNSQGARVKKKLLSKTNWFKKKKGAGRKMYAKEPSGAPDRSHYRKEQQHLELDVKTVLFLEQTPEGGLAKRMREVLRSMEPALGFRVKVVERTGQSLGSKFAQTGLWEGMQCGRDDCTTCEQGAEELPPCNKNNLLYKNKCTECNPGALGKGELEEVKDGAPSLYVGETSRTVYERSKEH